MREWAVGALLVLVVAVAGIGYWRYARQFESTDDAEVDGDIVSLSPRVSGPVTSVYVDSNQYVRQGELLAQIDPAQFQVTVAQARADVAQARANSVNAQLELGRGRHLVAHQAITPSDQDKRVSVARAMAAALELAEARLAQAELNLSYCRITSPVNGIIGKKSVATGDWIAPGQTILAISETGRLWVTANFRETQLQRVRPGMLARVHIDALGETLQGRVGRVGGATGSRLAVLPPENATGNFVKIVQRIPVRVELDPDQRGLERLRPGMSVEPKVRVQ
jgi:membrane fusion protein (multidrug efflux system)